jgi:hypothetical protein
MSEVITNYLLYFIILTISIFSMFLWMTDWRGKDFIDDIGIVFYSCLLIFTLTISGLLSYMVITAFLNFISKF